MLLYIEYIDCQWRTYPTLTCTWSALPWLLAGRDPAPVLCIASSPTHACPSPCPSLTVTGGENTQTQVKQYSFISSPEWAFFFIKFYMLFIVVVVVIVIILTNFSHLHFLLHYHWANLNRTWYITYLTIMKGIHVKRR